MSNREIKFRAWQKKESDMLSWNLICQSAFNDNKTSLLYDILVSSRNDFDVMQFTGIKDKNGIEIYEGDILGGYPHGTIQVKWSDEWACFESFSIEITFDDDGESIEQEIGSLYANDLKDCFNEWSVIGNIHQNPELL